jgi:hypothetical protein
LKYESELECEEDPIEDKNQNFDQTSTDLLKPELDKKLSKERIEESRN